MKIVFCTALLSLLMSFSAMSQIRPSGSLSSSGSVVTPAPTPTHPTDPLPPKYTCCVRTHAEDDNDDDHEGHKKPLKGIVKCKDGKCDDDDDDNGGHGTRSCRMMFVADTCPKHWMTISNHKLCLARVPGYNPRLSVQSQVILGMPGYKIKPCNL